MPALGLLAAALLAQAATPHKTTMNIPYRPLEGLSQEAQGRVRLDLHVPEGVKGFPTVVWFHAGGLTGGDRSIPEELKNKGIGVVAAGYRLYPSVKVEACIEDAAAAVAWTFRNIARHGGDPKKITVSGHSAGGYLAMMIGLDKEWLKAEGIEADEIAALVSFSGQCITHFTVRQDRGMPDTQPVIDRLAPLFHVRKTAPPLILVTGDRDMELLGRYEENAYMWRMMKLAGHPSVELFELQGYDHGGMAAPAFPLLLRRMLAKAPG